MKIVLDANIFISSFFWGGNPRTIFERIIAGTDELFVTKEILNEIEDVMERPKFHADNDDIQYYINSIEEIGTKITPNERIKRGSRDKSDNKYIECGIAANADYIISGDNHLLELKEYDNIKIVTAKDYLAIVKYPAQGAPVSPANI
jgi:putative PIN family toxin of toxin-antitoxin system